MCTREFKDIHALKSHQPKCKGRANAHGSDKPKKEEKHKKKLGRKLARRMDVTQEEVVLERQELRERDDSDDSEPARNSYEVGVDLIHRFIDHFYSQKSYHAV
jgi:hypothetical protein